MCSRERTYAVYILTNPHHIVLYTGVTNNLQRRLFEHRQGSKPSFTYRYHAHKLVYYELFAAPRLAIAREKQIKAGPRSRKVALIESVNPGWRDLSEDW
jgi:putative endonuclease